MKSLLLILPACLIGHLASALTVGVSQHSEVRVTDVFLQGPDCSGSDTSIVLDRTVGPSAQTTFSQMRADAAAGFAKSRTECTVSADFEFPFGYEFMGARASVSGWADLDRSAAADVSLDMWFPSSRSARAGNQTRIVRPRYSRDSRDRIPFDVSADANTGGLYLDACRGASRVEIRLTQDATASLIGRGSSTITDLYVNLDAGTVGRYTQC